jgi:hypothetical protein
MAGILTFRFVQEGRFTRAPPILRQSRHKHYNHLNKLIFFKIEALKLMNQFNDIKIL